LRLYVKILGVREDSGLRPTPQGTGIAKDSWPLAIGLALVVGSQGDG
jgi:hypothetical protein